MPKRRKMPTVREMVEDVREAATEAKLKVYGRYWTAMVEGFSTETTLKNGTVRRTKPKGALGDTPLDQVTKSDIEKGRNLAMEFAVRRSNSHGGQSAGEHYVAAARAVFEQAIDDLYISHNPALRVKKPQRPPSQRTAVSNQLLTRLWWAVAESGNDPELDLLLFRFHLETGARREGALNLTLGDLDDDRQTVMLFEKRSVKREQPVTRRLLEALRSHAMSRGATGADDEPVFRYQLRQGETEHRRLTPKRYELMFGRLRRDVPEAGDMLTLHALRHTAITAVQMATNSQPVAERFAGHTPRSMTNTYITVGIDQVAAAVALLWGEPHPLAPGYTPPPRPPTSEQFLADVVEPEGG